MVEMLWENGFTIAIITIIGLLQCLTPAIGLKLLHKYYGRPTMYLSKKQSLWLFSALSAYNDKSKVSSQRYRSNSVIIDTRWE